MWYPVTTKRGAEGLPAKERVRMKFIAILACKVLRLVGRLLGRVSSLPGQIALKLDPNILRKLKLPQRVIAVTGSNGKTSTVEMIAHVLRQAGLTVSYNKEGSNQIEGVATLLLSECTLSGRVKSDVVLLESDERFARHTFRHFTPTHYVITNLYRDQLTRNGHPEWIFDILQDSIHPGTRLILNADDPLASCFALGRDNPVTWFGVERLPISRETPSGRYNDGAYCPHCKGPMEYEFYHYHHIGAYRCPSCGLHRSEPDDAVTEASLEEKYLVINGKYRVNMAFAGVYHMYNTLAAFSACRCLGVEEETIGRALSGYALQNGRVVSFRLGDKRGTLLASKHENSVSYDQSIDVSVRAGEDVTVLVLVDAISRKYFTSETSWLWDIDFEALAAPQVRAVVLSGRYCCDLAARFAYTGVPEERLHVMADIGAAADWLRRNAQGHIYVITCFSDKDKFLSRVEMEGGEGQ